jgi:serine/threonine-protein kinase RsbW
MAELSNVVLDVANRPENVLLVREMLTGVAEAVELDENDLNDVLTAVTEACNNVVLHAYRGEEGPLEVEVKLAPHALEVVVRDYGVGIQTHSAPSESSLGIGLSVIQALVRRVELKDGLNGGTEVGMEFAVASTAALESLRAEPELPCGEGAQSPSFAPAGPGEGTTAVTIVPTKLARTVLPRILSTLAARAHFSTDRISDTQIVADALVAHVPASLDGGHLRIAVEVRPRNLELHIGPLGEGGARRLVCDSRLDGVGRVIEKLADHHCVVSADSRETLTLGLADRR